MKSTTFDTEGDVISTTQGTNNITVSFSRKINDGNYGTEELFMSMQLDVDTENESPEDIEVRVKANLAFAKALVYEQLGVETTVDENGIVRDVKPAPEPKKTTNYTKPSGGKAKPKGKPASNGSTPDKDALWAQFAEAYADADGGRIEGFYDNRAKKESGDYSDRSPDFKHIESGAGLWLDKASDEIKELVGV